MVVLSYMLLSDESIETSISYSTSSMKSIFCNGGKSDKIERLIKKINKGNRWNRNSVLLMEEVQNGLNNYLPTKSIYFLLQCAVSFIEINGLQLLVKRCLTLFNYLLSKHNYIIYGTDTSYTYCPKKDPLLINCSLDVHF
jgi:hypothetical protein